MKDPLGHGSNPRGNRLAKPIPGHPYHKKTDAELRYIIKDASEAEQATRGMSMYNPNSGKREDTAGKYSDQVNDAASVLAYRDRGGARDGDANTVAADALSSGGPKSAPPVTHDAMISNPTSYFSRVSAKNGRPLGEYGPHPDRETAARAAFAAHPNAKSVSTQIGFGRDIQFHKR